MLLLFTNTNNRPHKEYVLFSQLWQIMDSKPSEWLWCVVVAIDCHMQSEMLLRNLSAWKSEGSTKRLHRAVSWRAFSRSCPSRPQANRGLCGNLMSARWSCESQAVSVQSHQLLWWFLFWRLRGSIKSMTVIFSGLCPLQIMLRNFTSVLSLYTLLIMA